MEIIENLDESKIKKDGIYTRNLYLTYSKNENAILNGVDLNVKSSEIYALLGPSGCGKTTLLRCILGYKKANFGDVKLFNKLPGDKNLKIPGPNVGYMPQENALYVDLTIYEMLVYVGKIFQINQKLLDKKIFELIFLLKLPEANRYIKTLSGGQQRRVSFAVSIIHCPKFIVLDEPTAGVDPLLREKIWSILIKMKKDYGTTFIITTHYIEEARRAEKIGFLRKGRLLIEGTPNKLLKVYNCKTLEDVFLKICLNKRKSTISTPEQLIKFKEAYQNEKKTTSVKKKKKVFNENKLPEVKFSNNSCKIENQKNIIDKTTFLFNLLNWFKILYALIRKNLIHDLRDGLQLSFQFFSPLGQVLLFTMCIGRNPIGIQLGIYSEEFSFLNFSTQYLSAIDNELINLNYYKNSTQAIEDVKNRKLWGLMSFNKFYSHSFLERMAYNVSDDTIKNSTIVLNADISNKIVTDLTYKLLNKFYRNFVKKEFKKYDVDPKYALSYIEYPEIIYGKENYGPFTGYRNYMVPGIIINLTFALAIAITSLTLITERNNQTMERNFIFGITSAQMITSHIVSKLILSIPYSILIMLFPVLIFKLPFLGSVFNACLIILLQNIVGMGLGVIVAALSNNLIMSMVATSGAFMICLFTSGTLWPLEAISLKIRWFAYFQPTTLPTEALRSVMLRGFKITHVDIWTSLLFSSIWILVLFFIGIKIFKMNHLN